jgi:hypothetical protein
VYVLAILLVALALTAASASIGLAACVLAWRRPSWIAPAVGLAVLLAAGAAAAQLPGHGAEIAVILLALVTAALCMRAVRRHLWRGKRLAIPIALLVIALMCLPFAVSGRTGALGAGNNNDMVQHLTSAQWIRDQAGPEPVLVSHGYPLGPHGVAAAAADATGVSLVHAFDGLTITIAIVTALVALAALPGLPSAARIAIAPLVALCYLSASYLVSGAFKEPLEGLFLLAFVLALREEMQEGAAGGWRAGIPVGLLAAAPVFFYSYFGVVWLVAAGGVLVVVELIARRRSPVARIMPSAAFAAAAGLTFLALIGPQIGRMATFSHSRLANHPLDASGNLLHGISPAEALGTWLRGDYRFEPHPFAPTAVLVVLTAALAVPALLWWLRRRDFALPLALLAATLIYWQATLFKNVYDQAKALAIVAPIAAVTIAGGLAACLSRAEHGLARKALYAAAVLVVAGAVASSFLSLRDGEVGTDAHRDDLARVRTLVRTGPVLDMDVDDFSHWYFAGTDVGTGPLLYPTRTLVPDKKSWHQSDPFDFDTWSGRQLDQFEYVVEPRTAYRSSAPPNFKLERTTRWYRVWRRSGATPQRRVIESGGAPGAVLHCRTGAGRALVRAGGIAAVIPRPVVRDWSAWRGQPWTAGETASITVSLPRGHWDVSLQYVSNTGLQVHAPGMRVQLPATLGRIGPYWLAGTLEQRATGALTMDVAARALPRVGQLLGGQGATRALSGSGYRPLQGIAFTRHHARERILPLRSACGRYVDWYRPSSRPSPLLRTASRAPGLRGRPARSDTGSSER